MATKVQENDEATEVQTEAADGPLLDLSDAAVKKMIKTAKKRGYVTIDELNGVLPDGEVSSDQIEDVYAMLNEMGINVIETDEAEEADDSDGDEESDGGELTERPSTAVAKPAAKEPTDR
ncbi:MAG: RNA polymerase sigma factor RpoD, partial [Hyphomicrobiaceae bacterium]|nr:RNA polymerase sigma factor RpoD [Hyphomicrobiaceae bacterium]